MYVYRMYIQDIFDRYFFVVRYALVHFLQDKAAADPEFHRPGRQLQKGALTYYLAKFRWKLHTNEENLIGGRVQNFTM